MLSAEMRKTKEKIMRVTAKRQNFPSTSQMRSARTCIALAAMMAACSFSGQAASPTPQQSDIDSADRLFQSGKFAEAGKLYSQIVAQNPKDHAATLHLVA
jgi:hypothetical protein